MAGWIAARDLARESVRGSGATAKMRLFCLPHAGSGSAVFYRWKRELADVVDVCPVLLPGREMRLRERSMVDCEALVSELMEASREALDRPFAVFGHSMGALIAYEWTRRMEAEGRSPECLFVSGRNAAHLPFAHRELHQLNDAEFVEELGRRYGGIPENFLEGELREVFLPILRADLQLVETYRHAGEGVLRCAVTALAGTEDASVSEAGLKGWSDLTSGDFEVKRVTGGHFYHAGEGQEELLTMLRGCMCAAT